MAGIPLRLSFQRIVVAAPLSVVARCAVVALLGGLLVGVAAGQSEGLVPLSAQLVRQANDRTEQIAFVGDQALLAGDLLPAVDQALQKYEGKVPADQLQQQRALYVQQMLARKIEVKLVLLDFLRSIPADKQKEVLANIDKQVEKQYYDEQVPETMKQLEVDSLAALQTKLSKFGTSIEKQKEDFREQMLVRTMIGQKVERTPEITHDQLLKYYHEHTKDYDVLAQARWEQLTALFAKFPDRAAADSAIVEMGNQVLRGADFAAVAKKNSQEANATEGGYHDWTNKGSLVSEVLDQAIFSLPVNRLSLKLEDEQGFHIVRVIERKDARRIEFVEAQDEIRTKLQDEERKQQIHDYIEKLRKATYIWTIFDQLAQQPPKNATR
ncbi:MAG: peptidylprolyl isomerase [Pirellulaceae bacterium]